MGRRACVDAYTPSNPDFYLNHDFYKNENIYGCSYVQANCNVIAPSDNVIIYGHHMNDGTMFAELEKLKARISGNPIRKSALIP